MNNKSILTKKSFILYCDQQNIINKLTNEQAGALIKIIYKYCQSEKDTPKIKDPLIDLAFISIKITLDRDYKKYLEMVKKNRENGKKGGRPTKE